MKINVNKLTTKVIESKGFFNRVKGFMFKTKPITAGLVFKKCNAIHTFFMFQSIDIIMTDKNHNILFTFPNFKPNKIILPKKNVYYTYELPLGSINELI